MGQLPGRYNRAAIFRIFIFSLISEGVVVLLKLLLPSGFYIGSSVGQWRDANVLPEMECKRALVVET